MDAEQARVVLERLNATGGSNDRLTTAGLDKYPNTQGKHTLIAEYKALRPLAIRQGVTYDLHITAHETYETDGNAGDTETVSLSYGLVDADSVPEDVVVFSEGVDVTSDVTADYAANEIDVANTNADETLDIFYVTDEQARVEIRKKAPKNVQGTLEERDAGLINFREQTRDPLEFNFSDQFGGLVPTDWKVQVFIDAPYQIQWSKDRDNGTATNRNALIDLPIFRHAAEVEGAHQLAKDRIGAI
jgi:hypothetical protein